MSTSTLILMDGRTRKSDVQFENVQAGLVALRLSKPGSFLRVDNPKPLQAHIYKRSKDDIHIMGVKDAPPELNIALLSGSCGFESLKIKEHVVMDNVGVFKEVQNYLKTIDKAIRNYDQTEK